MIFLIALTIALIIGTLIAIGIQHDQGYVMLEYQDWVIETNIAVMALFFLVLFLMLHHLLRLIVATKKTPEKFRRYSAQKKLNKAQLSLSKSAILMLEGRWSDAEWQAVRLLEHSPAPLLHNLTAARAAFHQGAMERCQKYLAQAAESKEKNAGFAADIVHAELLLDTKLSHQALPILKKLQKKQANNPLLLGLLKTTYLLEEDWERLLETLKILDKKKSIDNQEKERLEQRAYHHLMVSAARDNASGGIQILWKRIPDAVKKTESIAFQYINHLLDFGEEKAAARALGNCLKKTWHPRLLGLYQRFQEDCAIHLQTLEGWLKLHGEDAQLLRITGSVALKAGLWEKARQYLESSLALEAHADSYCSLGLAMEYLEQPDSAAQCFKKGLLLTERSVLISLPDK